jgi:hypothetical protein
VIFSNILGDKQVKTHKNIKGLIVFGAAVASFSALAADISQVKIGPSAIEAIRQSSTPMLLDSNTAAALGLNGDVARAVVQDMTGVETVGDVTIDFHEETQMVDLSTLAGFTVSIPLSVACPECNGQGNGG